MKIIACKKSLFILIKHLFRNKEEQYTNELIEQKIMSFFQKVFDVLSKNILRNRAKILSNLKFYVKDDQAYEITNEFADERFKETILKSNIKLSLRLFLKVYKSAHRRCLQRRFYKWKLKANKLKKMQNVEPQIRKEYMIGVEAKKKELKEQIGQKERNISKIEQDIKAFNDKISNYKKTLKNNEEKESNYQRSILSLEEENIKIENEIKKNKTISEGINNESKENKKAKAENKIEDLKKKIKKLEDEMKEKETFFSSQFKEFNEMLDFFEQKASEIQNLRNLIPPQNSVKDSAKENQPNTQQPQPHSKNTF